MNDLPVDKIFPEAKIARDSLQCPFCGKTVIPDKEFKDELSLIEFGISGLCQSCQDDMFNEDDDDI